MKLTQEAIEVRIAEVAKAKRKRRSMLPEPIVGQIHFNDADRKVALEISRRNSDNMIVRYLRGAPFLSKLSAKGRTQYKFNRGAPYGVLVAFEHEGKAYVGWSKRHVKKEDLNFTKVRARYAAVLRGLTDTIVLGNKTSATTTSGEVIPSNISRYLIPFLNRAKKYTDKEFVNVSD